MYQIPNTYAKGRTIYKWCNLRYELIRLLFAHTKMQTKKEICCAIWCDPKNIIVLKNNSTYKNSCLASIIFLTILHFFGHKASLMHIFSLHLSKIEISKNTNWYQVIFQVCGIVYLMSRATMVMTIWNNFCFRV